MQEAIRIVLVDDHAVVRQGLRAFLATEDDIEVVGEATNGREAIELASKLKPDVVLMDLVMPEVDGIQATGAIKRADADVDIIAMTSFIDDDKVFGAMRAGATGYVLKDADPDEVVRAIRSAAAGEVHLDSRVAHRLMQELQFGKQKADTSEEALSEREIEVLKLVARGYSNQMIGKDLVISPKTAKTHVSNILSKLGLASRTQAAVYALKEGLVTADEVTLG